MPIDVANPMLEATFAEQIGTRNALFDRSKNKYIIDDVLQEFLEGRPTEQQFTEFFKDALITDRVRYLLWAVRLDVVVPEPEPVP